MSPEQAGPDPYSLLVPAAELGPEWIVDSSKEPGRPWAMTPSYAASYTDPAAGRAAYFVLFLESEAARAVLGAPGRGFGSPLGPSAGYPFR